MEAVPFIQKILQDKCEIKLDVLDRAYQDISARSKTLVDFANISMMYLTHVTIELTNVIYIQILDNFVKLLMFTQFTDFNMKEIKSFLTEFICQHQCSNEDLYTTLRVCLTGLENTPNVSNIMYALGKDECLCRLSYYIHT